MDTITAWGAGFRRHPGWMIAACVLLVGIFQAWCLPRVTPSGKDTTYYLEGAAGFATGEGFRHVAHVDQPPIRLFSPGQSAWLSGAWRLSGGAFPENYRWLASAQLIAFLAGLVVVGVAMHTLGAGRLVTAVSMLAVGLSPMATAYAHFLWSEPAFCLLAFLFLHRLRAIGGNPDVRAWLVLGLLGLGLVVWRKAGIGLVAGAGLAAVAVGRGGFRGALAVTGPGLAFHLAWNLYTAAAARAGGFAGGDQAQGWMDSWNRLGGAGGYLRLVGSHLREVLSGLQFVDALFGSLLRSSGPGPVPGMLAALALVVGLGFVWLVAQGVMSDRTPGGRACAVAAGIYLAETLVWVWDTGGRAVVPLASVALGWAWMGARAWLPPTALPWARRAVLLAAVPMLTANAWLIARYPVFADQRSAAIRSFARSAFPDGVRDGELAVDVELPALLVRAETRGRLAHLPHVDEFRGNWVPQLPGRSAPRWFLGRASLFTNGVVQGEAGTWRRISTSPDGLFAIGQRDP